MSRFGRCPDCRRRGVSLRWNHGVEDHYKCRYCGWSYFADATDESDRREKARYEEANSEPIMVECDCCGGSGETQAECSSCGVALTTANQSEDDPEGGCKSCIAKDGGR